MKKIILIGGVPRSGKTTLAQKLSLELGIPWISADAIESMISRYVSESEKDSLFPKRMIRKETDYSNKKMYEKFSVGDISDAYLKQADSSSKAIKVLVEYALKEDWGQIIEGYQVTPKLIKELTEQYKDIDSIVLVTSDSSDSINRSSGSEVKNDWLRDGENDSNTITQIGEMINLLSEKILSEAKEYDLKVVDMSNNFSDKFEKVFNDLK